MANAVTIKHIEIEKLIAEFALTVATTPEQLEVAKERLAGLELIDREYTRC